MTRNEIARVQSYLRKIFANNGIEIDMPEKIGQPVEVRASVVVTNHVSRSPRVASTSTAMDLA